MTRSFGAAIAVPEPAATTLHDLRQRLGDPAAALMPPHVTLLPPTRVPAQHFVEVVVHLEAVARQFAPFQVRLEGAATFRPVTPTVFAPLVEGADTCEQLADAIRSGPLQRDLPLPYHPHATVAYELPDAVLDAAMDELADFEADFEVASFSLYEADAAGIWQLRSQFALGGA